MQLLLINNVDYTNRILNPSYSVNSFPVYEEWTDGWNIRHRDVSRRRASGSFQMRFFNNEDFTAFLNNLNAVKVANCFTITAYVANEGAARSMNVFVNPAPSLIRYAHGGINHAAFDVSIEEA